MSENITIDLLTDPEGVQRVYTDINECLENADFSVPFRLIAKELERFEQGLFESEHAPDGTPWAPLRPATIARKGHDLILHDTGRLGASLMQETGDSIRAVDPHYLTFGTSTEYAGFLQDGTSRMPARPMVGLNEEVIDLIADYIGDGVTVALGGTP